jgi:hypothetical protein
MLAWATDPKVGHGVMHSQDTREGWKEREKGDGGDEMEQAKAGGDTYGGVRGGGAGAPGI